MNAEFHSNGYIQKLIEQYGQNSAEVKSAIEFWGPDAGEFMVDGKAATDTSQQSSSSTRIPDKG